MKCFGRVNIPIIVYKITVLLEEDGINSLVRFNTLVGSNYLDSFVIVFEINIIPSAEATRVFSNC